MQSVVLIFLSLTLATFASKQPLSPFVDDVQQVLELRDTYYDTVLGEGNVDSLLQRGTSWSPNLSKSTKNSSLWNDFLSGVAEVQSESIQNSFFKKTLIKAQGNRAELWTLFLEFIRIDNSDWANRTLIELDKENLKIGISHSPFMAQQLAILASKAYENKESEKVAELLDYSRYFVTTSPTLLLTQLSLGGTPQNDMFALSSQLSDNLKHDTATQQFFKFLFVKFLIALLTIFFILAIITVAFQTLTKAVHFMACKFPHTVPYTVRLIFTFLILLSLLIVGVYPLILLLLVLMGSFIKTPALKFFYVGAIIVAIILPFTSFVDAIKLKTQSTSYPIGAYNKALYEAPSEALFEDIALETGEHTEAEQSLLFTAQALIDLKLGNTQESRTTIEQALLSDPSSEPALLAAGAIFKGSNKLAMAETAFSKAVETYPLSTVANFNYGQFSLQQANTVAGNNHISIATTNYPTRFNSFLEKNSLYYSNKDRPLPRQFFLGDISPQFLKQNRTQLLGNLTPIITALWGSRFFGFSPAQTLISIFIIAFIIKIITGQKRKKAKIAPCPLCGKPTCQHCREDLCHDCNTTLAPITNDNLITSMKIKLANSKKLRIRFRGQIASVLIPGTWNLHIKGTMSIQDYLLFTLTLFVYTSYYLLWSGTSSLFIIPALSLNWKLVITIPLLIFNTIFIIRFITTVRSEHLLGKK